MPPIALTLMLLVAGGLSWVLSRLAYKGKSGAGMVKPYACGEDVPDHMIQPDYGQFFPFAFFFTILHVAALMITTVPAEAVSTFVIACVYIAGAVVGLSVLYKR
jgi:NADH-quinone oxidoreductase subunit A